MSLIMQFIAIAGFSIKGLPHSVVVRDGGTRGRRDGFAEAFVFQGKLNRVKFDATAPWVERFSVHGSGLNSANRLISIGMMPQ